MIKKYYQLAKPGIIYGNLTTAIAGFCLAASKSYFQWSVFVGMTIGISLVIASGCVFNNYIDSDIDSAMKRTKERASVTGLISKPAILLYGTCLGFLGIVFLIVFTNLLTTYLAITGFIFYVFVYTYLKRKSPLSTLVGSISGSIPPVVGYVAVTNQLDLASILLFLILVFWQMPHFYSIAIYRLDEYKSAKLPVLPIVNGVAQTKILILIYIVLFLLTSVLLTVFGYTGFTYLVIIGLLSLGWLRLGILEYQTTSETIWAKKMFRYSLRVIMALSLMIAIGGILP